MPKKHLALLALITTSVIWGATLPLMKINLEVFPPLVLAFIRFFIAAICALFFVKFNEITLKSFLRIGVFAFFGITLNIGLLLFGLKETTSIDAIFILALSPVITSLLAVFVLKEKISSGHALGIFLAFLGSFLYLVYPNLFLSGQITFNLWADFLILLAVLFGAIFIVGSKSLFDTYHPSTISAVCFLVGAISFFPGAALETMKNPSWVNQVQVFNLLSLIFLGVFASFIAYSLMEWGLSKLPVHISQVVSYLTPIVTISISTLWLNEKLYPIFPISALLVGAGIYLTYRYKSVQHPHYHHRHHRV
ncbi:MAG TPA: DMT family transporter [Candidatus Saccharimonadales bacterium]|nr:DMT family transporter [Candidatus Saccharimonadales bacterium]